MASGLREPDLSWRKPVICLRVIPAFDPLKEAALLNFETGFLLPHHLRELVACVCCPKCGTAELQLRLRELVTRGSSNA